MVLVATQLEGGRRERGHGGAVVFGEDDGQPRGRRRAQQANRRGAGSRVEAAQRFVAQQHRGPSQEHARKIEETAAARAELGTQRPPGLVETEPSPPQRSHTFGL